MKKRLLKIVVAVLVTALLAPSSYAWDFRLKGTLEAIYEYYTQRGANGFFGPYDVSVDALTGATTAARNGWLGIDATTTATPFAHKHPGVVSGSDASRSVMKMELYPEFRLNSALKIQGKYRIGGSNRSDPRFFEADIVQKAYNSEYINTTVPGTNNAFSFGEWTTLWVTAETPFGVITYGKRPWAVGCGLAYHGDDRTTESLLLTVPNGPMRIGLGVYPMTAGYGDRFFDIERPGFARLGLASVLGAAYWPNNFWDKNGNPIQLLAFLDYEAGPLSLGLGSKYGYLHLGPEGLPWVRAGNGGLSEVPTIDQYDVEGWFFAKYNNGRFFFNGEVDFFKRIRRYQRSASGSFFAPEGFLGPGSGSIFAPQYIDSWKGMIEMGAMAGPAKITAFYAYLPGPDRRHGILIDRQPTTYPYVPLIWDPTTINRHVGSSAVFRPYSLILSYDYGAGLNCMDSNGYGTMTDAFVLASRVDYAVASNLNLFASFFYAQRASHAWQWGIIYPESSALGLTFLNFRGNVNPSTEFTNPVPTIPDTSLGWEVTMGGHWKLLENWTLIATAAYWQPGRWFNYACVDRSVPNWYSTPSAANNWGVNPNRRIDPIFGLEVRTKAEF